MKNTIPVPAFDGDYVRIYTPKPDVYRGVDTEHFKSGEYYSEWITNDFSVLRDGKTWHIVGITHPKVPGFVSSFEYEGDIHEAEFQLFYANAAADSFASLYRPDSFCDVKKILYPHERPEEGREIWAPQLMKLGGKYSVIYSPQRIRMAESEDFTEWQTRTLFECKSPVARDPFVYFEDGTYYIIYTEEKQLKYRTTTDFLTFSAEAVLQESLFADTETESPFLMKRDGFYYLFWSAWNGKNGAYDERTFVFAAESLEGLRNTAPITMLRAHAPEIVTDNDGTAYLLSVFYPENGISAVRLSWQ